MADYFASVFIKEDKTAFGRLEKEVAHDEPGSHMPAVSFTVEQVRNKLKNLNCNKSFGPDEVHPRVLHELAEEISELLCEIFNRSLTEGVLPADWKNADITAIHKKGSKKLPENYRPISLTSVVSKIMESLIRDEMDSYMKQNNLFNKNLYGFRKGRSTTLQLLKVLDEITEQIDCGYEVDVIYTDFRRAFDSVSHKTLLLKLVKLGVNESLCKWIKEFLIARQQRVKIKGLCSS